MDDRMHHGGRLPDSVSYYRPYYEENMPISYVTDVVMRSEEIGILISSQMLNAA